MGHSLTLGSSVQVYRAKMDPVCFPRIKHPMADVQLYVHCLHLLWLWLTADCQHIRCILLSFLWQSLENRNMFSSEDDRPICNWFGCQQKMNQGYGEFIEQKDSLCERICCFFSFRAPWHLVLNTGTLTAPLGGIIGIQILRHHTDIMHYFGLDNCFF